MTSRNPDNSNSAAIAFDSLQQPCGYNNFTCPQGFAMDSVNFICYMILPNSIANVNPASVCPATSYSTLIQFYNDAEIDGFFQLLK